MSRRCRPGIRARIVCERDYGAIVLVVRRYRPGEIVNGAIWPQARYPWVVTSLSGKLRSVFVESGEEAPPAMTIVCDDRDLEPLDDNDDQTDDSTELDRDLERVRPL